MLHGENKYKIKYKYRLAEAELVEHFVVITHKQHITFNDIEI